MAAPRTPSSLKRGLGARRLRGRRPALVKEHLEGSPSRYVEMFSQTGMTRELVAKLAEGARLLEAPE